MGRDGSGDARVDDIFDDRDIFIAASLSRSLADLGHWRRRRRAVAGAALANQ